MGDLGDAYAAMSVQKCPCGAQPQGHPSGLCDACVAKRIVDRPATASPPAPGLDLDAVADTMRGLDNIFAQAMSSRDVEIARLTAELAAARAVTVDVCRYLDCPASDLLAVVTSLYESRGRAIGDATAARGTVGGLLAAARVEASTVGELLTTTPAGAVAEYRRGISSWQARMSGEFAENRFWIERQKRWSKWSVKPIPLTIAARLVIASEADADPSQRGPLPKGG